MQWSADDAMRQMWSELDSSGTNGDMMAFFKRHLQAAFDAGQVQEADAWREHVLQRVILNNRNAR